MRDSIPQVQGGARRRDGTIYVNEVKTSAKRTRLIPFIFNENTAYMLEFGDSYMRVYKNGARVAGYELATSFTESMLPELDYTQGADTMFIFHETLAIRRLQRLADNSWTLDAPITAIPFEEPGSYPAASLTPDITGPIGAGVTFTATAPAFSAADIDSSVKINGGIAKIYSYTDPYHVVAIVTQVLTATVQAPQNAWSLHAPAWSASRGYPRTGTLFEQRLVVGGSPRFPQTIWGSITGAYLDFTQGVADDDGFSFTAASDQINPIQYLASSRTLVAFTSGGEFTVTGGLEKPLAPTNAQIRQRSNYGCARVRPVRIRDTEMFIQRAGRKVRAFAYNVVNDDWTAPDISVLSEHATNSGIVDMCWQQEPASIVWMVRTDGVPVSVTYDKDQDVTAWAIHSGFTGFVESIATIPDAAGDQVWMVVKRTINGSVKRYIERFDPSTLTDCALIATSGVATKNWSGLAHLEGKEVVVVGDGGVVGRYTVTSGAITIARASLEVVIGLDYVNYVSLLPPELPTQEGSSSGSSMRTSLATARFHETTGSTINDQVLTFRTMPDAVDAPPTRFSGIKQIENLGWAKGDSEIEIKQTEPMPWHLLSVVRKLAVNG
ncbi:MAG: hypothetical protein V4451_16935 [Pseudomonadota bacterium]